MQLLELSCSGGELGRDALSPGTSDLTGNQPCLHLYEEGALERQPQICQENSQIMSLNRGKTDEQQPWRQIFTSS